MVKVRRPCQAGAFYAGTAESLKKQIENCFLHELGPGKIPETIKNGPRHVVGLVCPHVFRSCGSSRLLQAGFRW
jgi:AmmeMemoRadiSam system protein B